MLCYQSRKVLNHLEIIFGIVSINNAPGLFIVNLYSVCSFGTKQEKKGKKTYLTEESIWRVFRQVSPPQLVTNFQIWIVSVTFGISTWHLGHCARATPLLRWPLTCGRESCDGRETDSAEHGHTLSHKYFISYRSLNNCVGQCLSSTSQCVKGHLSLRGIFEGVCLPKYPLYNVKHVKMRGSLRELRHVFCEWEITTRDFFRFQMALEEWPAEMRPMKLNGQSVQELFGKSTSKTSTLCPPLSCTCFCGPLFTHTCT